MKKIYVGNLPYRVTKDEFIAFFSSCGTVEDAHLVSDRQTGRAKGFGFVTFDSADAAQAALKLNGHELQGRPVRIDLAREPDRRARLSRDEVWTILNFIRKYVPSKKAS